MLPATRFGLLVFLLWGGQVVLGYLAATGRLFPLTTLPGLSNLLLGLPITVMGGASLIALYQRHYRRVPLHEDVARLFLTGMALGLLFGATSYLEATIFWQHLLQFVGCFVCLVLLMLSLGRLGELQDYCMAPSSAPLPRYL